MSDMKEIFFTFEGKENHERIEVPKECCVQELRDKIAKQYGIEDKNDLKAFLEGKDTVLDGKTPVTEIPNDKNVHVGRCAEISVQIHYADSKPQNLNVSPSTRIAQLREEAIHHFKPDDFRNKDYRLANASTEAVSEEDLPVGVLTQDGTCSLAFNLVPKEKWQG